MCRVKDVRWQFSFYAAHFRGENGHFHSEKEARSLLRYPEADLLFAPKDACAQSESGRLSEGKRTPFHLPGERMATKKAAKRGAKRGAKKGGAKKARGSARKATKRRSAKRTGAKRAPNPAFMKPMQPDAALGAVVGNNPMPRTEITKKLWQYIKRNGCQDQKERRMINADDKLRPVFGGKNKVSMFEMTKLVNKHMKEP